MTDGEIRVVASLEELRACPPHTVIADARGQIGTLAQRPASALPGGVYWAGFGGLRGTETIVFPVQAWWPAHPALTKAG